MSATPSRTALHFSGIADAYRAYRPTYPAHWFDTLHALAPSSEQAWDVGAGSGQATLALAERFQSVLASDADAEQIARAPEHPRVHWCVMSAEQCPLPAGSVDLISVAQALHWFDRPAFWAEARRVLRPGGVLAVWSYGPLRIPDPGIHARVQTFYHDTVGPYWPPERRWVEEGYRGIDLPFAEVPMAAWALSEAWTLPQLLGYLRSWSATRRYHAATGSDPVDALAIDLAPLWGDPTTARRIEWPVATRVAKRGRRCCGSGIGRPD